ncbi:hypothetical protein LTR70_009464, partial [Exophiala xenobiotica]
RHVEEAYQSHIISSGHSPSPWLDVPTDTRTAAESEILDLWRGTAVDRGARPGELQDCIAQSLRYHHESQRALASSGASPSTNTRVDNTVDPGTSAVDASLKLPADRAAGLPAAGPAVERPGGGELEAGLEGSYAPHPRSSQRRRSPTSATSPQPALYKQPVSASHRPVDAESAGHPNGQRDSARGRSANQKGNAAAAINERPKDSDQALSEPPPRRPWYEEEIERLRNDIGRLVKERAEIQKACAAEKEHFEATIEGQKEEIEELRQDRESIRTVYGEFKRSADGVLDRWAKRRKT